MKIGRMIEAADSESVLNSDQAQIEFTCNVCSARNTCSRVRLSREDSSCPSCMSSVRMRAIVHLLSRQLFGESMPLFEFPVRKDIIGFGLSDWTGYAGPLCQRMSYVNTFYHTAPRLDITQVPEKLEGIADFLIATDVFEHVLPPVSRAFEGARRLLRPGGFFIFSAPFRGGLAETQEHFPRLADFTVGLDEDGVYRMRNRCADDSQEVFEDLVFHGGPGDTLEMRVFSEAALLREFSAAGFREVTFESTPVPEWGIEWLYPCSWPMLARA